MNDVDKAKHVEDDFPTPDLQEIVAKLTAFAGAAERILQRVSRDCFTKDGELDPSRLLMLLPSIISEFKK